MLSIPFHTLRRSPTFYRNLFALVLPIMLQNLITTSLGFIDTFMVGLVGSDQLSAVTAANSPIFFIQIVIFGLMSGLSVLVSQYWGKRDLDAINRALGVTLYVSLGTAMVVAAVFFFAPTFVMSLVTNHQLLISIGAPYLKIVAVGLVFNTVSSVYIAMQRSTENPLFGMSVFATSMLLNTFLNYCLIFGNCGAPRLEVMGAAYATLISRIVEFIIVVVYVARSRRIVLKPHFIFNPGKHATRQFFSTSFPVLLNETIWGLGTTMMVVVMGHMPNSTDMLSAFAIIGNVEKVSTTLCIGLASATGVVIGKAIGEGHSKQEVYELGQCLLLVSVMGGFLVAGVQLALQPLLFVPILFPLFNLSNEAFAIAVTMNIAFAIVLPSRSFDFTNVIGVLRAGGDVIGAFLIDTLALWLFAVPITAICGLVIDAPVWVICLFIHGETFVKVPVGIWRIHSKKWIHDLTRKTGVSVS